MPSILDEIVANTRVEVEAAKSATSPKEMESLAKKAPKALKFERNLRGDTPRIIAECKRKSPSKGIIAQNYDPIRLANTYSKGGAAAISCLTDERYFGGHLDHLRAIRKEVSLPLLRKDFIIDEYQIYEARAAGADSFLLLSGVLNEKQLSTFLKVGRSLGMEALVESHTHEQVELAVAAGAKIFGINNRDLKSFHVDLENSLILVENVRKSVKDPTLVCESGIGGRKDVEKMWKAGFTAFLVGETLVKSLNPMHMLASMCAPVN